jgi:hypothetical protein
VLDSIQGALIIRRKHRSDVMLPVGFASPIGELHYGIFLDASVQAILFSRL